MPPPEAGGLKLLEGLSDETQPVAAYFDGFAWDGQTPDPEHQSAEDFLTALGD